MYITALTLQNLKQITITGRRKKTCGISRFPCDSVALVLQW